MQVTSEYQLSPFKIKIVVSPVAIHAPDTWVDSHKLLLLLFPFPLSLSIPVFTG